MSPMGHSEAYNRRSCKLQEQRGLVMAKGQTFEQLYQERTPLYQQYAELTVDCGKLSAEEAAASIEQQIFAKLSGLLKST